MGIKAWLIGVALRGKLPLWAYRLAGKSVAKKLEEIMADQSTENKPWYKSKAKWAAVITGLVAAIQPFSTAIGHPVQVPLWVTQFLMGLGLYGLRDAINK